MQLGFYELQLLILASICTIAIVAERHARHKSGKDSRDERLEDGVQVMTSVGGSSALSSLMKRYLVVYAVVMGASSRTTPLRLAATFHLSGADWLQGPYVYSLYREQYGFPERMVAVFFVTGFLSAGLAAPLVGAWADQQ